MNYSDFFIAIYTHECKKYCDEKFFNYLFSINTNDAVIKIVDNSRTLDYNNRLKKITGKEINHIEVSRNDPKTQFLRNVCESVSFLRDEFLKSDCKYFVILESDVLPPCNWLNYFYEVLPLADIIGGVYYSGFHSQEMFEYDNIIQITSHVLSGCTLYKREIIEKFPFKWSTENLNAFPDAWISFEAGNAGFNMINYSKIQCQHLHDNFGTRGQGDIN